MADTMTKKMSQASASNTEREGGINPPKKGEKFRCQQCGMAIEVTASCGCKDGQHVAFVCCGQNMAKV